MKIFLTICRLQAKKIYWPFFFSKLIPWKIQVFDLAFWRCNSNDHELSSIAQHPSIFQLKEWNRKVIICKLSILANQRIIFNFWLNDDHLYIEPLSSIALLNQGFNAIHISVTLQEQSAFSSKGMLSVNQFLVAGFKYFSRMRSEGFPFIVGVWGWTCVRVVFLVSSSPRRRLVVASSSPRRRVVVASSSPTR